MGGPIVSTAAGALAGGVSAGLRDVLAERRAYNDFIKTTINPTKPAEIAQRYQELKTQLGEEQSRRRREAISDQIRYLGVSLKRETWLTDDASRLTGEKVLEQFLGSLDERPQDEVQAVLKEIKEAKLIDRGKLAKAVIRGSAFGAIGGAVGGMFVDWIGEHFPGPNNIAPPTPDTAAQFPHVQYPDQPYQPPYEPPLATETPTPTPTSTPTPIATTTPVLTEILHPTPLPNLGEAAAGIGNAAGEKVTDLGTKLTELGVNPLAYTTAKAAEVGQHLAAFDQTAVTAILQEKGFDPSTVPHSALEAARQAVQHAVEAQTNTFTDAAALTATDVPGLRTAVTQGGQQLTEWLASADAQSHLADVARHAVESNLAIEGNLANQVTALLTEHAASSLASEPLVTTGNTVSELLSQAGHNITWTADNAELLGAEIAVNIDPLKNMWHAMATVHPDLVSGPFPIGLSELADIVNKAKNGDAAALQLLIKTLHWISPGEKFKILTQAGVQDIIGLLHSL